MANLSCRPRSKTAARVDRGAQLNGGSVITEDAPDLAEVAETVPAEKGAALPPRRSAWGPWGAGVAVFACGLLITGALAVGTWVLGNSNEDRLLRQRVHEAATVIAGAVPNVQGPLLSAATVADTTEW